MYGWDRCIEVVLMFVCSDFFSCPAIVNFGGVVGAGLFHFLCCVYPV